MNFRLSFDVIVCWLFDRGYTVNEYTGADDSVYYDSKEVC
jgi:hypothetical protein